jgi:uncharacterized protein
MSAATQQQTQSSFESQLMHWRPEYFDAGERVYWDIIQTPAFQRLRNIRFLGAIDYLVVRSPNRFVARQNRFEHSLGVASLALNYARRVELPYEQRRLICVAALLHDIGHAPLSHSLEPLFEELFGINHHDVSTDIVAGKRKVGIYEVLREYCVSVESVLGLLSGGSGAYHGFFGGRINFDTIDGVLRSHSYNRTAASLPSPEVVMIAALERNGDAHQAVVDEFWRAKDQIYTSLIRSRLGVLADNAACAMFLKNLDRLGAEAYHLTEDELFKKLPLLKALLRSRNFELEVGRLINREIGYKSRRFDVLSDFDFAMKSDSLRYQHRKIDRVLVPMSHGFCCEEREPGDLFEG